MLNWILTIIIVVLIIVLWIMIYDTHRFVVVRYKMESDKVASNFRIVVLSDLHNKQYGEKNHLLIESVIAQNPDMICIAGDMLTAKPKKKFDPALDLIKALAQEYPIYYGNGNHEKRLFNYPEKFGDMYEKYTQKIESAGVKLLCNDHIFLEDINVVIHGLDLSGKYYKKNSDCKMEENYLEETLGVPEKNKFQILIAHNPDYFENYAKWGADLCFCGHVHGGLMKVPFLGGFIAPTLKLFPKYDGGEFCEGNSKMILSRGLGTHTLPIRIFNPGELVVVDVLKKT